MPFPLPLLDGEKILREEKAIYIRNNALGLGYNLIYGTLWLTSQRLVHQSALGALIQYPLSHITRADSSDVSVAQQKISTPIYNSTSSYSAALRVDFDTAGREYFIPEDIVTWVTAIIDAKTNAPSLPYIQTPPSRSALEEGNRNFKVIIGIMLAIVICFICSVGGFFGIIFWLAGTN